jgi:CRISPR/Cas system-associated exonuclease Cas4 (RecB family)
MGTPMTSALWATLPPSNWPSAPAEMTVTTQREIDACPRRWALSAAKYPDVWAGQGYPPRIHVPALAGSVVHLALETITKHLVRFGCPSVEHPNATLVLKDLGGYTKVVHDCINRILERFAENPRALALLEYVGRTLRGQAPELRARVQSILARLRVRSAEQQPTATEIHRGGAKARVPLTGGAFSEVELRASRIGWKGKADLLVLSDESCEIIDFKTGAPDEAHKFQLQVYALLWSLDDQLNPTGRLVDRLVLAYEGRDVEVAPPTAAQLAEFEKELIARRAAAQVSLSARPPEARPSPENCRYCGVRHLCDEYWMVHSSRAGATVPKPVFGDVELKVGRQHGATSWNATVVVSPVVQAGKPALLRVPHPIELRPDIHIRVLDAAVAIDPESDDQPAIVTLGMFSEMFAMP